MENTKDQMHSVIRIWSTLGLTSGKEVVVVVFKVEDQSKEIN